MTGGVCFVLPIYRQQITQFISSQLKLTLRKAHQLIDRAGGAYLQLC